MFAEPREKIKAIIDYVLSSDDDQLYDQAMSDIIRLRKQYGNQTIADSVSEVLQSNIDTYRRRRVDNFLQKYNNQFSSALTLQNGDSQLLPRGREDSLVTSKLFQQRKIMKFFAISLKATLYKKVQGFFNEIRKGGIQKERKRMIGSEKVRGRILIALFSQHFPADLKKKEFFYRWKVRSNQVHVKNVINKLVLFAKITPEIAYWRLRNLIRNPYDESLLGKKLNQLDEAWKRWENNAKKKMKRLALQNIEKKKQRIRFCAKMILELEKKLKKVDKKRSMKKLKYFTKTMKLKQKFFDILKKSGFEGVKSVFQAWKSLPRILDPNDKRVKMEEGLFQLAKRKGRLFITGMREINDMANTAKRRAMVQLMNKTMGDNKRLFLRWLQFVRDEKQFKKFQQVGKFIERLNDLIGIQVLAPLKHDKQAAIKAKAISKWISNATQFQRDMLKRWRIQSSMMNLNRGVVTMMLQNLDSQLRQGKRGKLRSGLRQFYIHMRIKKVQISFFKSLLSTNAGQISTVFRKWIDIPARTVLPANLFQGGMQRFAMKRIRGPLDSLKDIKQSGEQTKSRTMHTMLQKTMSSNRRSFIEWRQMVERDKMIRRCRETMKLFETLQQTMITKTSVILLNDKDADKMRGIFLKMVDQWKKKNYRYFFFWRKWNQDEKFNNMMLDSSQSQMITRMIDFLKTSQNQSTGRALRSFHKYYRIELVKHKVFHKLLDTQAGKILNLFTKWKNIPIPENQEYKIRVAKFERALHLFAESSIRRSFQTIQSTYQEALSLKNQAAIAMINKSMSKHKKSFLQWRNTVRSLKQQLRCKHVLSLFQQVNDKMSNNLELFVQYNLNLRRKVQALEKIGGNFKRYKQIIFDRWRGIAQEQRAEEEVEEEMVKRTGLKQLQEQTDYSSDKMLISALQQFKLHMRMTKHQFVLFKFMDKRKREETRKLMVKLMNLPNRNFPKESNKFQGKMGTFAEVPLKTFFEKLKYARSEAERLKNRAVVKLVNTQKTLQRDALLRLQAAKEERKKLSQAQILEGVMASLSSLITGNLQPILESQDDTRKKSKALSKLFSTSQNNQHSAIQKWKSFLALSHVSDKRKQLALRMLLKLEDNLNKMNQAAVLRKVKQHTNIGLIKKLFIDKILDSGVGQVYAVFSKWKYLPQITDAQSKLNFAKFQTKLQNFAENKLRQPLDIFEDFSKKADWFKKKAIVVLMEKSIHNHKRMFVSWRQQTTQHLQFRKCRFTMEFFSQLNELLTSTSLGFIKTNKSAVMIEKIVNKLSNNRSKILRDGVMKWRQGVQFCKIFDGKYKDILRRMVDSLKNNGTTHLRKALKQFQINQRMRTIQTNFFKQLFSTNIGQSMTLFNKWKKVPSPQLVPANFFLIKMQRFALKRERILMDCLKDVKHDADQVKHVSLQKLFSKTMSANRRAFIDWKTMVNTEKIIKRCQTTINLFETLLGVLSSNASVVLRTDKARVIVEKVISKLLAISTNRTSNAFKNWKAVVQFEKIAKDGKQRQMIQRMQDNLRQSGTNRFRKTLSSFQKFCRMQKIKKNVFDQLFATSAGKMVKVFMKWKGLPVPVDAEEKAKCVRFEQALHRIQQRPIKQAYESFQFFYREAEERKKVTMREMLNKTMSSHKRMFLKWSQITDSEKKVGKCRKTIELFNTLNSMLTQYTSFSVFSSVGQHKHRVSALKKIIDTHQNMRKTAWSRWLSNIQQCHYKDQLKKVALYRLTEELFAKKRKNQSQVLTTFHTDTRLQKLANALFKRLGIVKQTETAEIFQKWKNLPERVPKEKVHLFAEKMAKVSSDRLRQLLDSLRRFKQKAEETKKRAVSRLGLQSNGVLKSAFDRWNFDQPGTALNRVALTMRFFEQLQASLSTNMASVFESSRALDLKQKYLEKLVETQYAGARKAIQTWRKFVFDSVVSDEMRKRIIQQLVAAQGKSTVGGIRRTLQAFLKFRNIRKIQNAFFGKLLDTSVGSQMRVFLKWKALPVLIPGSEMIRAQKFERTIAQFSTRRLRSFFDPIKNQLTMGLMIKKDCLQRLVDLTMSDHKKLFLRWSSETKQFKQNSKCRKTMELFEAINKTMAGNIKNAFEFNRENEVKHKSLQKLVDIARTKEQKSFSSWLNLHRSVKQAEKCRKVIEMFEILQLGLRGKTAVLLQNSKDETLKAKVLEKLFAASKGNVENAFRSWIQTVRFARLGDETRKMMIKTLKNTINSQGSDKLRQILRAFKKNSSIKRYQYQFFQKLLQLNVGQQMTLFQKWKGLPVPVNVEERRKVAVFQSQMANIFTRPIRDFLGNIKGMKRGAEVVKKKAIYMLLKKTMGVPQKLFLKWRTVSADQKRFEHWSLVTKLFENMDKKIKDNFESSVLQKMGSASQNEKTKKLVILLERIRSLFERQQREGLHMIQRKASSVILRSYFASLWKWKFANLEAKYYTKYKQIYRQSAVMSRFVQIVSGKLNGSSALGIAALKNYGNKHMRLLNCIRIREREEIKLKSMVLSQWRQSIHFDQYQESFSNLMTSIAQQKLQRLFNIVVQCHRSQAWRALTNYCDQKVELKTSNLNAFVLLVQEKQQAALKRQLQTGFEKIQYRVGLLKTSIKMQALFKLINMDSLRIKQLQFAYDVLRESAFDANSILYEKRVAQQIFAISDIRISFEVLKKAALNVASSSVSSSQASDHQIPQFPQQFANQMPMEFSRRSFGLPPQPPQQFGSGGSQSQYQHNSQNSSINMAQQLISSQPDSRREEEQVGGVQGILSKIGADNLKVVNRLGAADHFCTILATALIRQKWNVLSALRDRSIAVKNQESQSLREQLQNKQKDEKKQIQQINKIELANKNLETQVNQFQKNSSQQLNQINSLKEELNKTTEAYQQSVLSQNQLLEQLSQAQQLQQQQQQEQMQQQYQAMLMQQQQGEQQQDQYENMYDYQNQLGDISQLLSVNEKFQQAKIKILFELLQRKYLNNLSGLFDLYKQKQSDLSQRLSSHLTEQEQEEVDNHLCKQVSDVNLRVEELLSKSADESRYQDDADRDYDNFSQFEQQQGQQIQSTSPFLPSPIMKQRPSMTIKLSYPEQLSQQQQQQSQQQGKSKGEFTSSYRQAENPNYYDVEKKLNFLRRKFEKMSLARKSTAFGKIKVAFQDN